MTWTPVSRNTTRQSGAGRGSPPCRQARREGFDARGQDGVSLLLESGIWKEECWGQSTLYHGSTARGAREPFGSGSGFEDGDVPASAARTCHGERPLVPADE